jgi:hypothetical protein
LFVAKKGYELFGDKLLLKLQNKSMKELSSGYFHLSFKLLKRIARLK